MGFSLKPKSSNATYSPGSLTYDAVSTDPLSGTVNDLNVANSSDVSAILLNATAAVTLNGLVGGTANRQLELINQSAFMVTIAANAGASTAANRFAGAATIPTGTTVQLVYNGTLNLWCVTAGSSAGGGGVPGGSNTQVQFNDAGAFAGDSGFTWNKTTNTLTLDAVVPDSTTPCTFQVQDAGGGLQIKAPDGSGTPGETFTVTYALNDITQESARNIDTSYFLNTLSSGNAALAHVVTGNAMGDTCEIYTHGDGFASNPRDSGLSVNGDPGNVKMRMDVNAATIAFFDDTKNVVLKPTANAAGDTNGFAYLPLLVGNQTGVPAKLTGEYANSAPVRVQNNGGVYSLKIYINGGWRSVALV